MSYTANSSPTQSVEASRQEQCPLCGREHYCYLIKNNLGETNKVLCQWTDANNPPAEWKQMGTAKDGRPIFVNLSLGPKRRKSQKYPDVIKLNPEPRVLPQWERFLVPASEACVGHTVRLKPGCPGGTNTLYIIDSIDRGFKGGLIAKLKVKDFGFNGKLEVPFDDIAEVVTEDPSTGAKEIFIEYQYSETQKVVRRQWTDRRKAYKGQTKEVLPHRLLENTWACGKGEQQWGLYHEDEAISEIKKGGTVFGVGGEQAAEAVRSIGLTATCNQGGEQRLTQVAERLGDYFISPDSLDESQEEKEQASPNLKPLLIIWGDNDDVGKNAAEKLLKDCYKKKIPAIVLDPVTLWAGMPDKGDAHDWVEYCKESGMSSEEMIQRLEFAIDEAIEVEEEDTQWRWQRQAWRAPDSHKGEIGFWETNSKGKKHFQPACNFDFQVEREIEDSNGGGLVLQVKRCFENQQIRVIINSTDYTKPDTFTDALKRALGTGIVCNLNKAQLSALIHTRLHEYRTTRQGKLFKRIDRYGQQADGTWVFRDRQYKPDGTPTNENESGWVFNPSLGKDDFIPCPELAPENPQALKQLVDSSRKFFGQFNINQVLLTMGWTVAGLHSQQINSLDGCYPLFDAHGEPGSCKTIAAETALSLVGKNWGQAGMLARASVSALYEHGSRTGSLPFFWDDPDRNPENEELAKSWYNWKPRKVRGNEQNPHSPMGITSNHVFGGEQAATYTRFVRVPFERATGGDKAAFQELKAAQTIASGAFALLIAIGFPKDAIAALEAELLQYLPLAHARIAQSLAIVTWYAQKIVELTDGTEDVKQWVIDHCCKSENDTDASGNSLVDFIDKILALEAESVVGEWNLKRHVERDGQQFYAIYGHDAWKLVDQRFKPATYNERSLKSLIIKAGGITDTTARFSSDRDQVLAYNRALLTAGQKESGELIGPNQPKTVPRKAWLIPAYLFNETDEPVTAVTKCNRNSVTALNPDNTSFLGNQNSNCNCVTEKNENQEEEKQAVASSPGYQEKKGLVQNSGYSGYSVKPETETTQNKAVEAVTNSVTPKTNLGYTITSGDVTPKLGEAIASPPPYTPSKDDLEAVEGNAQLLRDAINEMSWEIVKALTESWTKEFKRAVWLLLSPEDRKAVELIAKDGTSTPPATPEPALPATPVPSPLPAVPSAQQEWKPIIDQPAMYGGERVLVVGFKDMGRSFQIQLASGTTLYVKRGCLKPVTD